MIDILVALDRIPADLPHDDWFRVVAALKAELGDTGREIAENWSRQADNYKPADFSATWKSLNGGGITIATLFHFAKQYGWKPEYTAPHNDVISLNRPRIEASKARASNTPSNHEAVALATLDRWNKAGPADPEHGYLKAKGVQPHSIRQEGDNLLVPMFDEHNRIWSVQTISPAGKKLYPKGSRKKGLYFPLLGDKEGAVICEGFATGAAIQEATGYFVAVAFDCGNLLPVSELIRAKSPDIKIIIAADNDTAGLEKARKAAVAINAALAIPECDGTDFNDLAMEGGDVQAAFSDLSRKTAPALDWTNDYVLTDEEAEEMSNPDWIYENLIIAGHLIVIPAPGNGGKTTIMLHIAGELAPDYQVFYVNADVSGGDANEMVTEAKRKGYILMLPDMKGGGSMDDVVNKLLAMNEVTTDYSGVIFIFDTLKKMTNVINKSKAKELYKTLRGLSAKGMTLVLLAHTNKYNDADGKPIFEGTVDLRNDMDEMIYFIPQHHPDGSMTVSTDPDKKRGNHVPITFTISPDREVSRADEFVDTAAELKAARDREQDATIIEVITEALEAGKYKQAEIVDFCRDHHHGVGRRSVERVLIKYSKAPGKLWTREKAFQKNAWLYESVTEKSAPPEECTNW